ncbi:MAG: septum formation protein Maf [Ignavibacteria bacterium]|nr:septum formation protein Maf [Ignavibacteria bacterium]
MDRKKLNRLFKRNYVLASKSERRIKLLKQIGLKFISIDSGIQELVKDNYNPIMLVKQNALNKSRKVALDFRKEIIIGADTVVVLNGKLLNKPANLNQAVSFLKQLRGNKHNVYTGINVIDTRNGNEIFDYERTAVHFRDIHDDEIKFYVKNYYPLDKAGAYGIQDDFGCLFIDRIIGDYYNVVGLPLLKLYRILFDII